MTNKGGRPKKEFDKQAFEGLCRIQATKNEICEFFQCDEKTLTRWCKDTYKQGFSDTYEKKRGAGKVSLRRLQWQAAERGNVTMLIWLGKQILNQRDTPQEDDGSAAKLDKLVDAIEKNIHGDI